MRRRRGKENKCGINVTQGLEERLLFRSITHTCFTAVITHDGGNSIHSLDFAAFHEEEVKENLLQGQFQLLLGPQTSPAASSADRPLDGSKDREDNTS